MRERYQASRIAAYLADREHAHPEAAVAAGRAIAAAWNDREFWQSAILKPLTRCAAACPGMPDPVQVLARLVRRFGTHVHNEPAQHARPAGPAAVGRGWVSTAPTLACRSCQRRFRSDRTPLGKAGYCLACRASLTVACDRCGATCPGAPDGQRTCADCRAVPLGVQQYEDQQTAAIAAQQRTRRVLVTGSRTWTDHTVIRTALTTVWHPATVLVSGACPQGADRLCEQCWTHWGGTVERHPADWRQHGRAAGMVRNRHMVQLGAEVCLAFIRGHSRGATHCADLAEQAGIPTRRYHHNTGRAAA